MTKDEKRVCELISKTHNAFAKLKQQHPDDIRDFINGVHIMQGLLMQRIARRNSTMFPAYTTTVKLGRVKR